MAGILSRIYRYPVKGLSAQVLSAVTLDVGQSLPQDRRFAIACSTAGFDSAAPSWHPRGSFLNLVRHPRLAALDTEFDDTSDTLVIRRGGRPVARGRIDTPIGRLLIEQFLSAYLASELPGPAKLVEARGAMFSDEPERYVSILNLASVRDIERVTQQPVDPRRFRANLLVEGLEPWAETTWIGRHIMIGTARLEAVSLITRCEAANVNPDTGRHDLQVVQALHRGFGHENCGVHARVVQGGQITTTDPVATG